MRTLQLLGAATITALAPLACNAVFGIQVYDDGPEPGADASPDVTSGDAGRDAVSPTVDSATPDVYAAGDAGRDAPGADTGVDASPPSCANPGPGRTTCGAQGNESCCASLPVQGDSFARSYVSDGEGGASGFADPASVSSFRLDEYEVTVGRYRAFAAAWKAGYRPSAADGKHTHVNSGQGLANGGSDAGGYEPGWVVADDSQVSPIDANLLCDVNSQTWTISPGPNENLPINCVDWWEAYAFCIWDGGFLPSEAESEFASAGGNDSREYPWGSASPGTASQYAIYGCFYPDGGGSDASCDSLSNIAPVGSVPAGAGRFGQLDLAGNLWEWTLDWFNLPYPSPCDDCAYLAPLTQRTIRGSYFAGPQSSVLTTKRGAGDPTGRYNGFGVRCARTP